MSENCRGPGLVIGRTEEGHGYMDDPLREPAALPPALRALVCWRPKNAGKCSPSPHRPCRRP